MKAMLFLAACTAAPSSSPDAGTCLSSSHMSGCARDDFGGPCEMRGVPQPTCETPSFGVGWCVANVCRHKCTWPLDVPTCPGDETPIVKDESDPADCYCEAP